MLRFKLATQSTLSHKATPTKGKLSLHCSTAQKLKEAIGLEKIKRGVRTREGARFWVIHADWWHKVRCVGSKGAHFWRLTAIGPLSRAFITIVPKMQSFSQNFAW